VRAVTNLETRRLVGVGRGRRAVDLHKNLDVSAPVETVPAADAAERRGEASRELVH
jgi:hypothetical protein